eukprot:CAMPEP_0172503582 /NCGR_PEP_ID=MMETSP1066-20121228/170619_1 /TAXON_ID=671091 /ORGANISM="Coscinodiscus wailesii, Strain CCMP2513" /LENGTH=172 /DNA_ID=CAMNT_0013279383 /DNA_START=136 /DNA_END=654 /DNA_ORIENTATION=+
MEILHVLRQRISSRDVDDDNNNNPSDAAAAERAPPKQQRRINPKLRHCHWIEDEVVSSLERHSSSHRHKWDMLKLPELISVLKSEKFELTDAEILQVLNLIPRELVEIHLIVEDLAGRLSEEGQEELLETIGRYLTIVDGEGEENGELMDEGYDEEGDGKGMAEEEIWGDGL